MADNKKPAPQRNRPPRLGLPFEKRPTDIGSWAYEHRVGLCCMIVGYLALGIAFVSARIAITHKSQAQTVYIDLAELMKEELPQQEPEIRNNNDADYSHIRNRISDENGGQESVGERNATSAAESKTMSEFMDGLDEEAAAVAGRVQSSRDAFEKGRREEQEMIDRHKAQREAKEGEKPSGVKQKGKVLVSYSLPGRRDVSLHIPAYQCDGGGEVTVAITVNRNGKVVSASLKESSTSNSCINETAVMASRNSRFNVDTDVSDRQSGTITYIFVPQ